MTKKEAKIQEYLPEYLEGKSEEKKAEFLGKPLDRQYAAIMAWRHRRDAKKNMSSKGKSEINRLTSAEVIKHIQSLPTLIDMIDHLSDKDFDVMYAGLDAARFTLQNWHANRRAREIAALEKERDALQERIDALRNL